MVDLSDVYMTFFLPEQAAGRVALGQDVRIILDAAPQYVIPAKVSFVASTAQFTPKTPGLACAASEAGQDRPAGRRLAEAGRRRGMARQP
ncbi:hypothetical protein G6F31_021810 [Rhizopus arrhizus]|nr:hypothetical protein G6F31_021810 [Rhizopus arrhizus]